MPLPNFLILGAAKSGTTALYELLREHPSVFLPEFKEPYFLSSFQVSPGAPTDLAAYRDLFRAGRDAEWIGEASAGYLYDPSSPERIARTLGKEVRMIAILRHPVDRAYSMYWHRRRDAEEPLSFEEAIAAEPERIAAGWQLGWHYLAMGHYREQIERYRALFPRQALLLLRFEDFVSDRQAALDEVSRFLGIDPLEVEAQRPAANPSYRIRSESLERAIRAVGSARGPARVLRRVIPRAARSAAKRALRGVNREADGYIPLDPALRARLTSTFRADIEYLAREVRPAFGQWLDPTP